MDSKYRAQVSLLVRTLPVAGTRGPLANLAKLPAERRGELAAEVEAVLASQPRPSGP